MARPKIVAAEKNRDIPHDSHGAWSRCEQRAYCGASRPVRSKIEAKRPESAAAQGRRQDQIAATEKIVKYFTIRTVLGIGTGNSSAVVLVVPLDRSSKRGALLGPKRHPNRQDHTSTGVFERLWRFWKQFRDDKNVLQGRLRPSRMGSTLMSATSTEIFAPRRHVLVLMSVSAANGPFLRSTAQMRSAN